MAGFYEQGIKSMGSKKTRRISLLHKKLLAFKGYFVPHSLVVNVDTSEEGLAQVQ